MTTASRFVRWADKDSAEEPMPGSESLDYSRFVLVSGMHRSGTSAIAGALQELGADLGRGLMPAVPGVNEKGFFENLDIVDWNNRALEVAGSSWHALDGPPASWFETSAAEQIRVRLRQALFRNFDPGGVWVVKDPRICRLFPLWRPLLEGSNTAFIIAYRHPSEVVASLARRNAFSDERSTWLWLDHLLSFERETRGRRRSFVNYAELLSDPAKVLARVSSELGIEWRDDGTNVDRLDRFIEPTLRHHRPRASWPQGEFAVLADELYRALAADPDRPPDAEVWDAIRFRADSEDGERRRVETESVEWAPPSIGGQDETWARVSTRLSAVQRLVRRLEEQTARRDRLAEGERQRGDRLELELRYRLGQLRDSLEGMKEVEQTFADSVAFCESEVAEQTGRVQGEIEALRSEVAAQRAEVAVQRAELAAQRTQLARQAAGLERDRNLLQMLWGSKPWRAYARLGAVARQLRGEDVGLDPPHSETTAARMESAITERADRAVVGEVPPGAEEPSSTVGAASEVPQGAEEPRQSVGQADPTDRLPAGQAESGEREAVAEPSEVRGDDAAHIWVPPALPRPSKHPTISIVIPVHNQIHVTWHCIHTIANAATEIDYEVIVVDDASTDETEQRLSSIENLRLFVREENGGFGAACNQGAEAARGEYLLFLNNDTAVTDRWLDELVGTFDHFPDAGLVGAKLVYPNGFLQEAGGIVWRDGSAWNYGNGGLPDEPRFSYAREVDYCSGACLLVPRDLFVALEMFDALYEPAYYEDVDLAFRVRRAGKKVIYQPRCAVIHLEGTSCGTDLSVGVKRFQVENGKKFYERWRETLATHRANGDDPEAEKERQVEKRCLVIDFRMLTPDRDAGSLRMWGILEILRNEGWKVTFLPDDLEWVDPYAGQLQARGIEVIHAPFVNSVAEHLELCGDRYDFVILSRVGVGARNIDAVRNLCPQAEVFFDTVDLNFVREERQAERERDRIEKVREIELAVAKLATKTIVVSDAEVDVLREHAPDVEVALVSTIYEAKQPTRGFSDRFGALFVGGFGHPPNGDSMLWFEREILPLIVRELPDFHLTVVGSDPPQEIRALESKHITIAGYVPDLDPCIERARLSIAPLRFGAGVKGKLTQALAHGLPSVATTVACEGMGVHDGVDILVADSPQEFARQVVRAHEDEELWGTLSAGGLSNTEANSSMEVARRNLLAAIEPRRSNSR